MPRLKRLQALGLSSLLLRLASGECPHPALAHACERRPEFFDGADEETPIGPYGTEVLWWSSSYTLVLCGEIGPADEGQLRFWQWDYDDPATDPWPVAKSEAGLLFWLFGLLLERGQGFAWGDADELRRAAESVDFRGFEEVLRFWQTEGGRSDYSAVLSAHASGIEAEPGAAPDTAR